MPEHRWQTTSCNRDALRLLMCVQVIVVNTTIGIIQVCVRVLPAAACAAAVVRHLPCMPMTAMPPLDNGVACRRGRQTRPLTR